MITVRPKLCYIVSNPMTITSFLVEQINFCSKEYDIFVIANCKQPDFLSSRLINANLLNISINRKINIIDDFFSLIKLIFIFNKFKFNIIHSITPKAGLLAQLAGWIARIPVRIHIFTGQVWITKKNPIRFLLKSLDTLTSLLSTHILVDSLSQRDYLISERVISAHKSQVLNKGSISGVNTKRFYPDNEARYFIRSELLIPQNAFVLLFLGRLNTDKGVLNLAHAYAKIANNYPNLWLLFVGPDEENLTPHLNEICSATKEKVIFLDFTNSPESYFNAADLFCLPSYREGFGTSVIEAAACGIPAVASRIYGLTDAVIDGETGLLHNVSDIPELIRCLEYLINDKELYKKMADAALFRVITDFDQKNLSISLFNFYQRTLLFKKI